MKKYEELESLYQAYDKATSPSRKKEILEKILEIDPDDIDSMHRLISFLPKTKRFNALLKLKENAKEIVARLSDEGEDLYSNYETRPYIFILHDILCHYEENKEIEKAFEIMQEISLLNEGDNLGIRFHMVAYYFGQNKLDELKRYVETNMDDYSVALRFGSLYLDEIEHNSDNCFKSLFDEFPYLYSFLTKEINLTKEKLDLFIDSIEYYSPRGFYDQMIFYKLLTIFMTSSVKKALNKLVKRAGYFIENSVSDVLPKITKPVIYGCASAYTFDFDKIVKLIEKQGVTRTDLLKAKESLRKYDIIEIDETRGEKRINLGEAFFVLLRHFVDSDYEKLFFIDDMYNSYIRYLKEKKH